MFIDPIQLRSIDSIQLRSLEGTNLTRSRQSAVQPLGGGFGDVIKSVWDTTVETQQDLAQKQYLQSIGEIDDTYTVPIAASKAEVSLSLLVSLRNKALDAYSELMRMSV